MGRHNLSFVITVDTRQHRSDWQELIEFTNRSGTGEKLHVTFLQRLRTRVHVVTGKTPQEHPTRNACLPTALRQWHSINIRFFTNWRSSRAVASMWGQTQLTRPFIALRSLSIKSWGRGGAGRQANVYNFRQFFCCFWTTSWKPSVPAVVLVET